MLTVRAGHQANSETSHLRDSYQPPSHQRLVPHPGNLGWRCGFSGIESTAPTRSVLRPLYPLLAGSQVSTGSSSHPVAETCEFTGLPASRVHAWSLKAVTPLWFRDNFRLIATHSLSLWEAHWQPGCMESFLEAAQATQEATCILFPSALRGPGKALALPRLPLLGSPLSTSQTVLAWRTFLQSQAAASDFLASSADSLSSLPAFFI